MCFSAPVSLATYLIGSVGSLLLMTTDVPLGWLYLTVVQMQLVEYLLWTNPTCNRVNRGATTAGIVINHLEPLVFYAAALATVGSLPLEVHVTVMAYALVAARYTSTALETVQCTRTDKVCSPHLYWKWNDMPGKRVVYGLFLLAVVAISLGLGDMQHAVLSVVTFGFSALLYGESSAVGSMWCFMAAFMPWLLLQR